MGGCLRVIGKLAVGAVGLFVLMLAYFYYSDHQDAKRREYARTLIRPEQLELQNFQLGFDDFGTGRITGRVVNRGQDHTLRSLKLRVRIEDCVAENECVVIAEETPGFFYINVPPGQARDVSSSIYPSPRPSFRGKWRWGYGIDQIEAVLPEYK